MLFTAQVSVAFVSSLLVTSSLARPTPAAAYRPGGVFEPLVTRQRQSASASGAARVAPPPRTPVVQLGVNTVNPKLRQRSQVPDINLSNPKSLLVRDTAPSIENPKFAERTPSQTIASRGIPNPKNLEVRNLVSLQQRQDGATLLNPKAFVALGEVHLQRPSISNPKLSLLASQSLATRTAADVMLLAWTFPTSGPFHPIGVANPKNGGSTSSTSTTISTSTISTTTSTRSSSTTTSTKSSTSTTSTKTSSTTSTAASTPTPPTWPTGGGLVAGGYFTDWTADILPPSLVDMNLFDLIAFAFLVPTSTFGIAFSQDSSEASLISLVSLAHARNTKVIISIGGWTDSGLFSTAVATSANRATFVKNVAAFVKKYKVDGVDIDWEYPGTLGAAGNVVAPSDTANLLLFLKALRKKLGKGAYLTVTATQSAFVGSDGNSLVDVSPFAAVINAILIMNYDVWGSSSNPGPNAPLSAACRNENQPTANAVSAIQAWTNAGMPAKKLLLGIPSYGYVSASTAVTLVNKRGVHEYKSVGHQAYEKAKVKRDLKLRLKRQERERNQNTIRANSKMEKRAVVFCPGNHSGGPCPGVTGQNITKIDWNPLNVTTLANGTIVTGNNSGIFQIGPGTGVGKLGTGDLSALNDNTIEFYQLISYGVILAQGAQWVGVNGYTRAWDSCSATPYLYDVRRAVVITYDDPQSLALKGNLALSSGLAGMSMWDMAGDTATWTLVNAWRASMGK